jgi:acyl dehydratase
LDRDQTYRYAGVSGDRAPHALDDSAAHREGFPSKILQGTLSLAMAAAAVVKWAGDGDPRTLRRLAVRFSAPVLAKRELDIEMGEGGAGLERGTRGIVFEGRQGETVCLRRGWAEFA